MTSLHDVVAEDQPPPVLYGVKCSPFSSSSPSALANVPAPPTASPRFLFCFPFASRNIPASPPASRTRKKNVA